MYVAKIKYTVSVYSLHFLFDQSTVQYLVVCVSKIFKLTNSWLSLAIKIAREWKAL